MEEEVGTHVANLIPDGATLQMGIGAIPDAALRRLLNKQDLGVHTEMFSDGIVDLAEAGAITNRLKKVHPGRIITSFVAGTQRVYDFVNDNPFVETIGNIRSLPRLTERPFSGPALTQRR